MSDAEYIQELEDKVKMLISQQSTLPYFSWSTDNGVTLELMPNAEEE
ncbi:hypothetical protein LCGC14_1773560 [marine sediment metagenome]|uniref:Uncharacterized protein n=1 Tax=marine sediment metagenome TaxID=412755 RepID=A0A0F9GXL2_9ZZZZ